MLVLRFLQGQLLSVEDMTYELQDIIKDVLGIVVAPHQPLMEVGLYSLSAVELRNAISTHFGNQDISTTFVFDHPTINAMSQYLHADKRLDANHKTAHTATTDEMHDVSISTEVIAVSCRYPKHVSGVGL